MNDSLKSLWSKEYQRKGIPSSFRQDPTQVLVNFIKWVQSKGLQSGLAADLGCGKGRNSFYLAKEGLTVVCLDLLQENADSMNAEAKKRDVPVKAYAQDASQEWPIETQSLDIAIDVFCYKHIVNKEAQRRYRKQLSRTLKSSGYYFISLASDKDGFYGPLLESSPDLDQKLIIDPISEIPSFLYSLDALVREFSDDFILVEAQETTSSSPMYGKDYSRSVLNCIFQKKNKKEFF